MKKLIMVVALCAGSMAAFAQGKAVKDTVMFDKSFVDAGMPAEETEYHLQPKFYKAGVLAPEQPIALSTAKKEAMALARAKPTDLRKDCLNIIYTVDPIYSNGSITGATKGTIVIRWDLKKKVWEFSYMKYQLINIDQNACVFMYEE